MAGQILLVSVVQYIHWTITGDDILVSATMVDVVVITDVGMLTGSLPPNSTDCIEIPIKHRVLDVRQRKEIQWRRWKDAEVEEIQRRWWKDAEVEIQRRWKNAEVEECPWGEVDRFKTLLQQEAGKEGVMRVLCGKKIPASWHVAGVLLTTCMRPTSLQSAAD
ncbi:hypothetical protein L218DRAFT_1003386 [Marasmius fiardii PR-910]|nr:hypothetical protein L218DRAFT_1003386 [Marasmius fiardii PR-910]